MLDWKWFLTCWVKWHRDQKAFETIRLRLLIGSSRVLFAEFTNVSVFNICQACTYQDMLARKVQQGCPLPGSEGSYVPICCPVDGKDSAQCGPPSLTRTWVWIGVWEGPAFPLLSSKSCAEGMGRGEALCFIAQIKKAHYTHTAQMLPSLC